MIERLVPVMRAEADSIALYGTVDSRTVDLVADFIRMYADRCHHGKEEDILFRRLADKEPVPELSAQMDELIDDHRRARAITRRLIGANEAYRAGDSAALDEIRIALLGLAELYPVHIAKEDRGFFKPCLEYFSDEERAGMLAEFEHFDQGLIHEKYRLVADTLESRFR